MEVVSILIFWISLYLAADVYYEKIVEYLKHPIATKRIQIDEPNEKRFRVIVFSPVVILLFFSAFRKMPELNHPYSLVWVTIMAWISVGVVYYAVNAFFPMMVNGFLKEKYEYRVIGHDSFKVGIIKTTILIFVYVLLRLIN